MLDGPRITWILRMTADSFYFIDFEGLIRTKKRTGLRLNADLSSVECALVKKMTHTGVLFDL